MDVLRTIVQIIYIGICIALTVVVLKQEGKVGLSGALTGVTETYWAKNKGRSKEGMMVKVTELLAGLFIVLSVVLNLNW